MAKRILLDISTLARASGHADGIVRTLRELAQFALLNRPEVVFVFYDTEAGTPRRFNLKWAEQVAVGSAKIDTSYFPDPQSPKQRFRERLPAPLKRALLWAQRPRRQLYLEIERLRLKEGSIGRLAEYILPWLVDEKYARELTMPDGGRRRLLPHDIMLEEPLVLAKSDVLILAGSEWLATYEQLVRPADQDRARTVVLCYDIIPLLFPQFFLKQNREAFRDCFHEVFPRADLIIFTAKQIMADARTYCAAKGIALGKSNIVYLGADFEPASEHSNAVLPAGLAAGQYALFVSTLEPRKGHRLLFEVWKRLLAAGVPQGRDFKLVFVGRQGWLVDELIDEMKKHPSAGVSLIMLSNVNDVTLQRLYGKAAFCLYPSLYEGFGLPVIEAFRHGKAVIASNGGALLETVGGFSPCLDPTDQQIWYDTLKEWIENPKAPAVFEQLIRSGYTPRSWQLAAADFFDLIDQELP